MAGEVKGSRTYISPLRAEQADQTRQRILSAARELFLERGYAGTKVQDVAAAARVSPDTVYVALGGKKGLLEGVWSLAVTGSHDPEGREQRERVEAIASCPDPRDRLRLLVELSCETLGRVSPVHAVLRAAADGHPFAADLQARMLGSRLDTQARNLRAVLGDAVLQPGLTVEDAAEHYSALLSPELFHLLTVVREWTLDRYQHWVWETLCREFFAGPGRPPSQT
ncbi:MAG TPA: TetR/AcrR family transcriptional regulator [Nocardioides sp.]|uniref:TetR/AcrR family transcriptional regulator n=1 Tax=Nocardioides sp. TaxID=35761 RepID=UPI002D80DB58|nr:TetR/AcrR family transcriptional regulator [Nocardioides sp.]HET6652717.1 TetR/AcrR family transcriptional regulator [Nocardioides sp.]